MSDATEPGGPEFEARLDAAMRRAEAEARPRPGFREELRRRFVAGDLEAAPAPPLLALPRWVLYPAAAAILAAALALSGALEGSDPADPPIPVPESIRAPEAALAAAEKRARALPALAATGWRHLVVEGRPWLLPEAAAFADGKELRALGAVVASAEAVLRRNLPEIAARPAPPVVVLVAPTRRAFEALVGPRVEPQEVGAFTIAFALREPGVLLVSPEALGPGGPPCEQMYILHEAMHAWLHARAAPGAALPLWADEGIAGAASAQGYDPADMCRRFLVPARRNGIDPFRPEDVLGAADYGSMVRFVGSKAPRAEEEPYCLVPLFFAHAESLVLHLADSSDPERRGRFVRWLGERLDGKPTDPASTAKDLGFESPAGMFEARDGWLGLE